MTRDIAPSVVTAVTRPVVKPFFAVELLFDTGPLYLWTGIGDLVNGGNTYTGAGDLLQISQIQESADLGAKGATLSLSGIPSSLISTALTEPFQGRVAKIKFGVFDDGAADASILLMEDDFALLMEDGSRFDLSYDASTYMFDPFIGTIDQMNIDEGPETATISISVESKLIDLEKPRTRRYTDQDQRSRFAGDAAFQFVTRLQEESLSWGT